MVVGGSDASAPTGHGGRSLSGSQWLSPGRRDASRSSPQRLMLTFSGSLHSQTPAAPASMDSTVSTSPRLTSSGSPGSATSSSSEWGPKSGRGWLPP